MILYCMRHIFKIGLLSLLALCVISCEDNDDHQPPSDSNEIWGTTYSHANLGAYPDIYSKYWVYAYETHENPNIGLRISGVYPQARFFSFSIYNDLKGEVIDGLDDVNISPDDSYINPYNVTTNSTDNRFTIYLLKEGTNLSIFPDIKEENVCYFSDDVECVSVCLRQYLGEGEYGGVRLPAIEGVDMTTGKVVAAPKAVTSKATIMKDGNFVPLESDKSMEVPFLLSPRGDYFPNNSTDYLYCRTQLTTDQVLTFSFIPAPIPACVEEYRDAKARYWSICIGSVMNTYSYCSFYDRMLEYEDGEKITVAVISANNAKLAEVKNAMQNILLEELEKQEGILIATTNLTTNMDKAFERRFLYKIEFNKPNTNTKALLWQSMIKDLSEKDAQYLANQYDFSGGQIENIARKQIVRRILFNTPIIVSEIQEDCKNELLSHSKQPCRPVGFTA